MKPAHRTAPLSALLCTTSYCLGAILALFLVGCNVRAFADGTASANKSYTRVNRGVHVEADATVQNIRSVNGPIRVEEGAQTGNINSVNGSVRIGDRVAMQSLDSVNGAITVGHDVTIEEDIGSVNGSLTVSSGTRVGGTLKSVNGAIRLTTVHIDGNVESYNGGIALLDGCVVEGDIRVKKRGRVSRKHLPKIIIGADTQIRGTMIFERPVHLFVHDSATIGEVRGAEAERYSGETPG